MGITKKQKEVLDYIKSYSYSNGYAPTQKEIKEEFGLKSFGSVQRYIKYLVDGGHIENDENARRGLIIVEDKNSHSTMQPTSDGVDIPLLGNVAAGIPIEAIESPDNTISVPNHMISQGHKHFALSIVGDSMIEDGILEDDVVVIKHQENANQGQTVVAVLEGEATLKKFFKNQGQVELHPANSTMSPIIVDRESGDFKIVGVLVGLLRSYV